MNSFCNVYSQQKIIKCISQNNNKCYLFVGKLPFVKEIMKDIKKNKKNGKDTFNNLSDNNIIELYEYMDVRNKVSIDDISAVKGSIIEEMYLDKYSIEDIIIIYENLYSDDTNETILNKICFYCFKGEIITIPFLYVWYYDIYREKNLPIGFEYDNNQIEYIDFFDKVPNDIIDTNFINNNGDKIPNQIIQKKLNLFEMNDIQNNVLYFCTLHEYLKKIDIYEKMIELDEQQINNDKNIRTFLNSILLKYWTTIDLNDILIYDNEIEKENRMEKYKKDKRLIDVYNLGTKLIENEFITMNVNDKIECSDYTITILKLNCKASESNTIHLSKLFSEYKLSKRVPFIKLLLESHDDAFYKVYEKSLLYSGYDETKDRYINKELCEEWSESYNIQTDYGYRYLHSGNIILFKIYNSKKDIYCTLVIHLNGDIECIIENNKQEMYESDIELLIQDCNDLIKDLNQNNFYSFQNIIELNNDIFTNIYSETQIEFLNCGLLFNKDNFEVGGNVFPEWKKLLTAFMINFPMYTRLKLFEETEEFSKIVARYKRVNNFANLTTIQSAISIYQNIYDDPELDF